MTRRITHYFTLLSPWAYIGHAAFTAVARKHDALVDHRPVNLMEVFSETGGLPLPKRHPARQRYRTLELQRWREHRGLDFHLHPRFWPFDVNRADRVVIAAVEAGQDPEPFMRAVYAGIWENERDLGDADTVADFAAKAFTDADRILQRAQSDEIAAHYARNAEAAIAADAFGSPVYILDGEVFWGQDRIELLDHALTSGRAPYSATA